MCEEDSSPTAPHGYTPEKDAYLKRLRRIEGQVRGVARMVEQEFHRRELQGERAATLCAA